MTKETPAARVLPFRARRDYSAAAAIPVGVPAATPTQATAASTIRLPRPSGSPLHLFAGPGGSSKSFVAKYRIDRAIAAGKTLAVAELDPSKRELVRTYGPGAVMQPTSLDGAGNDVPTNDPAQVVAWSIRYLEWLMSQTPPPPALMEFGGGDTALIRLVSQTPDLNTVLEAGGVSPVMWHFLTGRVEDLGTLKALEDHGFQPKATVLVFSDALLRQAAPEDVFGRVWAHPVYERAIKRGAVPIRIPALPFELASEIDHGMRFSAYEDHMKGLGMGGLMIRVMDGWMQRMEAALAPLEEYPL